MFSTTTGWPRFPPMALATSRAMTSVAVPAPVGTIIRTGRGGQAGPLCACACTSTAATHASTSPSPRPMRPRSCFAARPIRLLYEPGSPRRNGCLTMQPKLEQPPRFWDRLFAPSSCLAMITTVDAQGRVNAASYGTCTPVNPDPVHVAFTRHIDADNARNVLATGEFVVNLPRFDPTSLQAVRVV